METIKIKGYTPLEGFTLPDNGFYSIPDAYMHLPIKTSKYPITNWEWYQQTHGNNIKRFLQDGPNFLAGIKEETGGPLGMRIAKGGDNWPKDPYVSITDIEIKRVNYYCLIDAFNEEWERYPKLIIDAYDDVAFYIDNIIHA